MASLPRPTRGNTGTDPPQALAGMRAPIRPTMCPGPFLVFVRHAKALERRVEVARLIGVDIIDADVDHERRHPRPISCKCARRTPTRVAWPPARRVTSECEHERRPQATRVRAEL